LGTDFECRSGGFAPPHSRDLVRSQVMRAAIAGREGRYRDGVAPISQQSQRASRQNFHIVRVGMNGENVKHKQSGTPRKAFLFANRAYGFDQGPL
jgi:hypothetical protein